MNMRNIVLLVAFVSSSFTYLLTSTVLHRDVEVQGKQQLCANANLDGVFLKVVDGASNDQESKPSTNLLRTETESVITYTATEQFSISPCLADFRIDIVATLVEPGALLRAALETEPTLEIGIATGEEVCGENERAKPGTVYVKTRTARVASTSCFGEVLPPGEHNISVVIDSGNMVYVKTDDSSWAGDANETSSNVHFKTIGIPKAGPASGTSVGGFSMQYGSFVLE